MSWPELPVASWSETLDALHLWTQVVGKVRMALEPMVNHWWQVTLYVSSRGLTTSLMPSPSGGLEIEFDFVDHVLDLRMTDGRRRSIPLRAQSVAAFYRAVMAALDELGVPARIRPIPSELPVAIPFPEDTAVRAYDPEGARRWWEVQVQATRLLKLFRSRFIGKASPVHYFWGGADLAVTRFSGRTAPRHRGGIPNCPDWVQWLAYSHEVSSCGFWAGGGDEGSFYAYAYPEPPGFAQWPVPPPAHYDATYGDFLLPYAAVRRSSDPDGLVLAFLQSTYEAAAELGRWDRSALEAESSPADAVR